MKIAIMQPYFFPYIGYFQLINLVDEFVVYDDVNYINRGWINRNKICVSGNEKYIQVPLNKVSQNKLIKDISVVSEDKWKQKIIKTVEFNYKKSPFFNKVITLLTEVLYSSYSSIAELNLIGIKAVVQFLNIQTHIIETSTNFSNSSLKGQDRILDICQQQKAETYINPIGGRDLYNKELFEVNNLTLKFLNPRAVSYPQQSKTFLPFLSIIDVLMNCDVEYIHNNLLNEFELR